ncbi:putative histone-lysine N-methyltransferase 1 [Formica exsecta]|uniref:putative histone-lysine N-methyltransferase 1 n=1 Tax=Formica exsecta TaxID=72781 RepID=UPI00114458AA|nr:putative histone-lysine N-methyltransferase 1 [Formica exsecta]
MPRSTPTSKRSESRRSSILKPRKPRQPLQNVNFDSPHNEKSLTPSKTKRRVSFADKKHVKEFCHSIDQGTVWDNTYEEHDSKHDSSLKGSFVSLDSNAKTESKENASLCISNNEYVHILENNSSCSNNSNLTNNQLFESNIKVKGKDNENCDLDFTNPIEMKLFDEGFQFQETILPNKSGISQPSKDATLSSIACSNTDEKYVQPSDETSQHEQNVTPNALFRSRAPKNATSSNIIIYRDSNEENNASNTTNALTVSNVSKNATSSNIIIYRDSDEEKNSNNTGIKSYSELCCNNVDSELDMTCAQDLSMEFTTPMHTPLLSLHAEKEINVQKDECSLNLNLNTNWVSNCNNVSIQAVPISVKPVNFDLGIFEQISKIQTHGSTNSTVGNNTHNKTIFSTNLQSNIASENTVFKHTQDATQNINESMMLTNVIQPFTTSTDISHINSPIQTHGSTNSTAGNITHNKTIFSTNLQSNIASENTVFKHTQDATQNVNESMMLTNVIQPSTTSTDISHKNNPIQTHGSTNSTVGNITHNKTIFSTNLQSNIASENIVFKHTQDATQNVNESMMLTNVIQPSIASTDISHVNNTAFNVSLEMTTAISSKMYDRNIAHPHDENIIKENNLRENQIDKTEFFNDVMEITKPVNMLPLIAYDKENLKIDELISKDDRTMFFHDVSMEMTKVLKNQEEITRPIVHKSISEESTCKKKNMDNSNGFDEKTRLLYKSMEITEAVPVSLHHEKTLNTICAAQSTSFSQTMSKARLPVENSTESTFQADTAANKTIQHVSMEITDTILSTLHLTQDATNERENLNISRDNEFQHLTTDNLTKLKKSAAKENYIISREITETTDTHDELPDNFVIPSLSNNLDHSLNAVLKNISSTNKTIFDENEQSNSKKICKSFMEFHTPQENNVCLSPRPNDIYINDTGHNECFVKDTMDHTGLSRSNFRDDLNEISDCSLLKTLGNNIEELQSIKPPSFILLDSYKDENSFSDALCKDKLQISTGDGTIDNIHNSSNQLVIDNIPEYECLAESRKSIAKDNESFTVLRENESINIENIQMEDCSRRTIANKTEQEDDCQAIRRIIINDNRINESNHCRMNVENFHAENVLSIQNNKHEETNTDHCKSPIIKENEIIAEVEYIQERVNNDANPQNNVKEKEEYSDVQRLKTEQCTDHIKRLEAIENQLYSENNCKENLNDEVRVTEMEQNEECTEERLAVERCVSANEDESLVEQDPFLSLSQKLETHCERDDCIWNMYHKNIDRKMFVFGFISNSLLIAMYLSYDLNCSEENLINKIKIISRVSDDSGVLVRIVHKLILEKLDAKLLMYRYRTHEDILPMLECVSEHVKLAMNFMFDLKHLDNLNLMEITYDHISFLSRSKQMDTILKVTVKVKRFDELTSKDVNVHCLLGTIRETDVKSLIKNIKKDHKFLRKYINDVKDYIDIMEETSIPKKV